MRKPLSPDNPYYSLKAYFNDTWGTPIYKIGIDAGFSCPNRDGTIGYGGCHFCNPLSFMSPSANRSLSVTEQIQHARAQKKASHPNARFLAYYQPYTNSIGTYQELKSVYEPILAFPDIIGLAIGTRPDCITPDFIKLLYDIQGSLKLWIELGIQTKYDHTLALLNRGHTHTAVEEAVSSLSQIPQLEWVAHLILGLPGETKTMMVESTRWIHQLKCSGIKFHQLQIIQDTELEHWYSDGKLPLLSPDAYFEILGECLLITPSSTVIHRLFSDSHDAYLVAPIDQEPKATRIQRFRTYMKENHWYQGKNV